MGHRPDLRDTEGPNDGEWQVGPATHEWKAAENPDTQCFWPSRRRVEMNPRTPTRQGPNHSRRSEPPKARRWKQLMEEVCQRENLERAWKRVRENKGSPGVDGMTIDEPGLPE